MLSVEISVAFFIQRFGINELTITDNDAPVTMLATIQGNSAVVHLIRTRKFHQLIGGTSFVIPML